MLVLKSLLSGVKPAQTGASLLLNTALEMNLPARWPGLCCQKLPPHTGLLVFLFFWGCILTPSPAKPARDFWAVLCHLPVKYLELVFPSG